MKNLSNKKRIRRNAKGLDTGYSIRSISRGVPSRYNVGYIGYVRVSGGLDDFQACIVDTDFVFAFVI